MDSMADFDDKLNSLLSNPDAMSQIMQLAQSLSGGQQENPAPPPSPSPPSPPPQFSFDQLFQGGQNNHAPSGSGDLLSSLTGGMDPSLMLKLLPLIQELGGQQDSNARHLLYALRPYLREDRQAKVERALQLARLFHVGKKFLAGWEGW